MSPGHDIAMETAGVLPAGTEKIEIIAAALEEICTFLVQAPHLMASCIL